ncbi:MAG: OmpH family outer membrane protein [Bacteroidales bacterium]|nr:OmpH family outer membrane protein [Bacteroidales bacterium]
MKKTPLILSIIALAGVIALAAVMLFANPAKKTAETAENTEVTAHKGAIVYFDLDRVLEEYDMATDLRAVVETKVQSINEEVNRRGSKLEKDIMAFQDKIDKGLLTRSVAEIQNQKLQEQNTNFQNYAAQKQQEIVEEQQVMTNQIADAIKTFLDKYNAEKQYSMIIATQGNILSIPVTTADPDLDITDDILAGLNAEYIKEKANTNKR